MAPDPDSLTPLSTSDSAAIGNGNRPDQAIEPTLVSPSQHPTRSDSSDPTPDQTLGTKKIRLPDLKVVRQVVASLPVEVVGIIAVSLLLTGLFTNTVWLGIPGAVVAFILSLRVLWPSLIQQVTNWVVSQRRSSIVAVVTALGAIAALIKLTGLNQQINTWISEINWDVFGALGEVFGAIGQILIAVLALYVTWRQYIISKDLTIQQNRITQQQTIDSYFQGIADLVLDDEGLLEDWPQERALAEGRTAAILGSVDAEGKAKVLRFLSGSKLLTPLQRDRRLGRPIFDGMGGYAEDVEYGVRVIDLGIMLVGADLQKTDLRWTDLSEANLVRANLSHCDLTRANLCRAILYDACLVGAELERVCLFYGSAEMATPRSRAHPPNYNTGAQTGAVVENADFTDMHKFTEEQRYYCCAWGGAKTRATIPGGCEGIPNRLGR